MRVLITGGTGFIGSNLAFRYLRDGHEVVAVGKEATPVEAENAREMKAAGVDVVVGSITDRKLMADSCRSVNLVHHIAAAMREANLADEVFWEVNVQATEDLLEAAFAAGAEWFVYCSSIGAMGKSPDKPADEGSECRPEDIYQVTKNAAEKKVLAFQKERGVPLSVVRPADVYGPRDRRFLKLFRGVRRGRFPIIGSGENEHHMVYIDDLVQGMVLAAQKAEAIGEVFILAGDKAISVNGLVEIVAREFGVRPPRLRVPLAPVRAAAVVCEALCKPVGIQPPLYPRRVDFFRTDYAFDISKAKRLLSYSPEFGVAKGVHATRQWYESKGLL